MDADFFVIGEVVNTQGARGDLRVVPSTDDVKRFEMLKTVYLEIGGVMRGYELERVWYHRQFVILKLRGVDDMNAAERLKWAKVKIPPSMALPLGDDEYYERDLVGMTVLDEGGGFLGKIARVVRTGANDVYEIVGGEKDFMLPAIKQCVVRVDVAAKTLVARLLPGLLEL